MSTIAIRDGAIYLPCAVVDTYFRGMERRGTPMHWLDGDDLTAAIAIVDTVT